MKTKKHSSRILFFIMVSSIVYLCLSSKHINQVQSLFSSKLEALSDPENENSNKYRSVKTRFIPHGEIIAVGEDGDTLANVPIFVEHYAECLYPDPNATRICPSEGSSSHFEIYEEKKEQYRCPYNWLYFE